MLACHLPTHSTNMHLISWRINKIQRGIHTHTQRHLHSKLDENIEYTSLSALSFVSKMLMTSIQCY
jgi:hypothetical protein